MITGSNLWDKLRGSLNRGDSARQSEFIKNMQEAGVDELNTFYAYLKNANTEKGEACFVALIPLKDAMKWEAFVKKTFDQAQIKENKTRKESKLTEEIYAGWTKNLLILISVQVAQNNNRYNDSADEPPLLINDNVLAAHLESAFAVSSENSLMSDERFVGFQKNKHDLGFWVNIDAVMSNYGSKNIDAMTGGLSLSNTMWRNSAFSAGTNFEKGSIVTDMVMYSSDELKEINKKYSPKNIDEELVNNVPSAGLDFMMAYSMSPEATQKTIEKMGMLGLANGYLKAQNISIEEIMSAISGDMVFAMNNYNQTKETLLFDSSDETSVFANYKTDMDVLFAIKLNQKAAFAKILKLAIDYQMLQKVNETTYKINSLGETDSSIILVNDRFAVFSNKKNKAYSYLNSAKSKNNPKSKLVFDYVNKQPFAMVFDFNNWAQRVGGVMASNEADSLVYKASLGVFQNFVFNGGRLDGNTYKYKMSINLVNKKESSLIQLFEYGKTLQEAQGLRAKEEEEFERIQRQNADSLEF